MKPHKILRDYRYRNDFPEIARNAAAWLTLYPDASADDLLQWADSIYGGMEDVAWMRSSARYFKMFGEKVSTGQF